MIAATPLSGALAKRFGHRIPCFIGALFRAGGLAGLAWGVEHGYLAIAVSMVLMTIGLRTVMTICAVALVDAMPANRTSIGAALNDTAEEVGTSFGTAVVGTMIAVLVTTQLPVGTWSTDLVTSFFHGERITYAVLAVLVGVIAGFGALRSPTRTPWRSRSRLDVAPMRARHDRWDAAAVGVVRRAVPRPQRRLLIGEHEDGHRGGEERQPYDEGEAAEGETLAGADEADADVHRVTQVAVEAADDQFLGRRRRRRRPPALADEAHEAGDHHRQADEPDQRAEQVGGVPASRRPLPARDQPRDQTGHRAGSRGKEDEGAERRVSHADTVTAYGQGVVPLGRGDIIGGEPVLSSHRKGSSSTPSRASATSGTPRRRHASAWC
jgi:hypothetical protein